MKKHLRSFEVYFVVVIGLSLGIGFYYYSDKKNLECKSEIFTAILASIVTISISRIRIKIEEDRMFKDLFDKFNQRYDTLNDFLNELPKSNRKLESDEKNKIYDYFNMCSEQYLWHQKGRIPKDVWVAWREGIAYYIKNNEIIKGVFCEERDQRESYYGFIEEMEKFLNIEKKAKNEKDNVEMICPDNEKV